MNTHKYFDLQNKVIVITGGLGILGSFFAEELAKLGARVVVLDIRESETKKQNVHSYKVDITNKKSIEDVLKNILFDIGEPNVLINCAAIDFPPNFNKDAKEISGLLESDEMEKLFDKVMEVNVKGLLMCSQVFGKQMSKHNGGSIINISSIYGVVSPDQRIYPVTDGKKFIKPIAYSVSKSALFNLTRYLSTYWTDKKVRVNTLTFGGVYSNQNEEFVKNYCSKVPLGRMAKKEDYIGAIIFLSSDDSSYMTGSNLIIDGGYTAW